MKYSIFIFLTLLCLSCDKPRPLGGASATYTYYGADQKKKAPVGFEYLPKVIQDSSTSHLRLWLGPKVFEKFKYAGGRIIDRTLLSPSMRTNTTIPDCILFFNIYNDTLDYTGSLPMSEQGKVLEHFNFPNTAKTGMFSLISEKDVLAIASKESKTEGKLTASFQYDNDSQIFIWVVDVMAKNSNVTHKYTIITINAQTGKVLGQREGIFYSY